MRVGRLVLSFFLILSSSPRLNSQQSTTAPPRDAQAVALLNRAVAALGGTGVYSATNGVIARGTLTASTGGISGPIVWENAGTEFRYERPGPNSPIVFASHHGNPGIADSGKVRRNIGHLAMVDFPAHLPGVVLAAHLNNSRIQVTAAQQVTLDTAPAIKISLNDQTDELSSIICKQDWYLDPATLLPTRVDYLASEANNALNTAKMTVLLSDYRPVSGQLIPFHIVTLLEGQQILDVVLTSVQLNASIPRSDFEVSATVAGGVL